jgi:putative Mg2+ transporter-C (MgtC) family protein
MELEYLLRIFVAAGFAGLLGLERESARRFAGLRTHIIVGVGSALFSILGILSVAVVRTAGFETGNADPTRIIYAIALGIGFLGSGVVFVSRNDDQVHGLTTAASIWTTAAVGVACAFGLYVLAGGVTLLVLFVLRGLRIVEGMISRGAHRQNRSDNPHSTGRENQ